MFSVILVDDEPWALQGIEKSFEWEKWGFEVIYKTTNSLDAMQAIQEKRPDVIFTDIRMQDFSGIDIMKKSREMGIESEFIIVSGYGEFIYAQEAIKQGAFYYLLKPIDMDEAQELIGKLSHHIKRQKSLKKNASDPSFLDNFFISRNGIEQFLSDSGVVGKYPLYQAVFSAGMPSSPDKHLVFPQNTDWTAIQTGFCNYVYILNCETDISQYMLDTINKEQLDQVLSYGISSTCDDIGKLPELFKEADVALHNEFIYGKGTYPYKKSDFRFTKKLVSELIQRMEGNNKNAVHDLIMKFPGTLVEKRLGIEDVAFYYNQIAAYISYSAEEVTASNCIDYLDYESLNKRYKNLHEISQFLDDFISVKTKKINTDNMANVNDRFMTLLSYVDANYSETLYLSDLSKKFFLNSTYICDLFKKVTGKTSTEYIALLRINQAGLLLKDTKYSVMEVAENVGFKDYYHFIRTFKKILGVTPAKYRGQDRYVQRYHA